VVYDEFAAGGMATVHFGCLQGPAGFSRVVAIKRMHLHLVSSRRFRDMFLDEAKLAARISHPNVVPTLDVLVEGNELFIVMEYVRGVSFSALLGSVARQRQEVPLGVAVRIICDALAGLHAAHEARDRHGDPLGIVHRDVSPQNILVGVDGVARVTDFGVALAKTRSEVTQHGELKGKPRYMAPEQLTAGTAVDRRADVYAAAVVLWSALAGHPLFRGDDPGAIVEQVLHGSIPSLAARRADVPEALVRVLEQALSRDRDGRFATARELAAAIERAAGAAATAATVGPWVESLASEALDARAQIVAQYEGSLSDSLEPVPGAWEPPMLEEPTGQLDRRSGADVFAEGTATRTWAAPATRSVRRAPWWLALGLAALSLGVAALVLARSREPARREPLVGAFPEVTPARARRAREPAPAGTPAAPTVAPVAPPAPAATALPARSSGSRRAPPPPAKPGGIYIPPAP
jgi:serine/threonine-protein kinase